MTSNQDRSPRFEYFRGYPARYRRAKRHAIYGAMGCLGPLVLAPLFGIAAVIIGIWEPAGWTDWLRFAGLIGFSCLFGWVMLSNSLWIGRSTTIVPYFQRQLGNIDTFARGHSVARCCENLDALALQAGLLPLSAFGFNDDLAGEVLTWHAPETGLATISGLLEALQKGTHVAGEGPQLLEELAAMEAALRKAADQGVPFCLLLRVGDGTSAMEWEQRQGSCF